MPRTHAESEVEEPLGMSWTIGRVLAVVVSLAMIAFWAWIFAGGPKKVNPDRLDDRAYVAFAKERCQTLRDDIAELPNAVAAKTAAERADVLDQSNLLVARMVHDLEAKAPRTGDDGISLKGWLADWRTYVDDREDYAARLRTDPNARMDVTENKEFKDGVDETIRVFADVNDMPTCRTPGDVG